LTYSTCFTLTHTSYYDSRYMLTTETRAAYLDLLRTELVPALGCTEPIAVALAAAKAREVLCRMPERAEIRCSGNIIKNVKGVVVPNTGGLKGIEAAALAGIVGGDSSRALEALSSLGPSEVAEAVRLLESGICEVWLAKDVDSLYIAVKLFFGDESAEARIIGSHANIAAIFKNGLQISGHDAPEIHSEAASEPTPRLNVRDILEFADSVPIKDIEPSLSEQIRLNSAISDEGLKNHYGVEVGKTLLEGRSGDMRIRAEARAAAGSDARMSGCALPVVINSGSGNQGMTASLPVIEYASSFGFPREKLYRALVVSNLVAIHQKRQIGRLSAYCGAVSAAAGSGAGISYLRGGDYDEIAATIVNTIATIGGMVCDGAKPSCAAKVAQAVDAAFLALDLSSSGKVFASGEGLVKGELEDTIASVGRMGSIGMKGTDDEILAIMTDRD
jgi:L-cysteine desulfidase